MVSYCAMHLTNTMIISRELTAAIVSVQIATEGFNLDRSVVVAIYTRHCVRLNCIHIAFEAARVAVCETREETRCIGTYKSHNNLIDPAQNPAAAGSLIRRCSDYG